MKENLQICRHRLVFVNFFFKDLCLIRFPNIHDACLTIPQSQLCKQQTLNCWKDNGRRNQHIKYKIGINNGTMRLFLLPPGAASGALPLENGVKIAMVFLLFKPLALNQLDTWQMSKENV